MHDPRGLNSFKTVITPLSLPRWKRVVVVYMFSRSLKSAALLWVPRTFCVESELPLHTPTWRSPVPLDGLPFDMFFLIVGTVEHSEQFARSRVASRSVIARTTVGNVLWGGILTNKKQLISSVTNHQRFVNEQTTRLINKRTTYSLQTKHVWLINTPPCCLRTHQVSSKTNHVTTYYQQTNEQIKCCSKTTFDQQKYVLSTKKTTYCLRSNHVLQISYNSCVGQFVKEVSQSVFFARYHNKPPFRNLMHSLFRGLNILVILFLMNLTRKRRC